MKYIITVILIILIAKSSVPTADRCDLETAKNALPVRIFYETTTDSNDQHVLITRFFHNKATIVLNELGRCYLNFFDLNLAASSAGTIGLLPWFYFIYKSPRWPILLAALAIIPLVPILSRVPAPVAYAHKVFAIIGLLIWIKRSP